MSLSILWYVIIFHLAYDFDNNNNPPMIEFCNQIEWDTLHLLWWEIEMDAQQQQHLLKGIAHVFAHVVLLARCLYETRRGGSVPNMIKLDYFFLPFFFDTTQYPTHIIYGKTKSKTSYGLFVVIQHPLPAHIFDIFFFFVFVWITPARVQKHFFMLCVWVSK